MKCPNCKSKDLEFYLNFDTEEFICKRCHSQFVIVKGRVIEL